LTDKVALEKPKDDYSELKDLFPALQKYKTEHSAANLQKLCVEIKEFCKSVYASTENEQERNVYYNMVDKLTKK
jgi:hypothetical protein